MQQSISTRIKEYLTKDVLVRVKPFASPKRWKTIELLDQTVVGEVRSKGATYFKTTVNLTHLHSYCTCSNRTAPCLHVLGILLLINQASSKIETRATAEELTLKPASELVALGANFPFSSTQEERAVLQQKNKDKRIESILGGHADLRQWLDFLMRKGLIELQESGEQNMEAIATRLTDAKMGAAAKQVRLLADKLTGLDWRTATRDAVVQLQLISKGLEYFDRLSTNEQKELLSIVGVNTKKAEVLAGKAFTDEWLVLGVERWNEDRLKAQKIYVYGRQTKRTAYALEFAFGGQPLPLEEWEFGKTYLADLYYYPSLVPRRAAFAHAAPKPFGKWELRGYRLFTDLRQKWATLIGQFPLLDAIPIWMLEVVPKFADEQFWAVDQEGLGVPLKIEEDTGWKLLTHALDEPLKLFCIWDGKQLEPISFFATDQLQSLLPAE